MSLQAKDKVFISIGGLALVLTSVWAFFQQSKISSLDTAASAPTGGSNYESNELKVELPPPQNWPKAVAQPAGENWIYNVFTPPKIYYNTQNKQFTVIPPELVIEPTVSGNQTVVPPPPPRPSLELVKVVQPVFRLQLVGYIGDEGNYRGTFSNELTGKTFFGTSGRKIPDLNLEIVTFEAKRQKVVIQGGSTLVEVIAYAIVKDTVTGKEYRLEHDKRLADGPLVATVKLVDGSDKEVRTGDSVQSGESIYKVGAITLLPPSVVVTKSAAGEQAVDETLTVPPPAPPAPITPVEGGEIIPGLSSEDAPPPASLRF
jgi:hypothetical protein